ncbi:hypothetical protein [Baia soyae]|uniref:Uncharacterized protein n=1 Tax=Baia soyae TaxID=1544746 RepID=A0A4R2RQQ7_9BACL|nr:hypothetical protein [Baia soyae]TCP65524.1 hypothetical protein EDD57_1322 [Baia soyae]
MDRHIAGVLPEFPKVYQTVEQLGGDSDLVVRGVVQNRDFYKEDVVSEIKVTEVILGDGKVSVGEVVPFVAPYVLDTLKSDDEVVLFGNLHAKDDRIQRDYYESVGAFQGQFLVRGSKVKRLTDTLKSKVDREAFPTLEMGITNLSVRVQMK